MPRYTFLIPANVLLYVHFALIISSQIILNPIDAENHVISGIYRALAC